MASRFSGLPAEIRALIWNLALQAEMEPLRNNTSRLIEFHHFDPISCTINVRISRRYPQLFRVNREARYEAAKIQGCEWVSIHIGYNGNNKRTRARTFEVCINFDNDHILLADSFIQPEALQTLKSLKLKPEQARLNVLANMLDKMSLDKIQSLIISTQPPPQDQRLERNSYWKGEGLEILQLGALKIVTLVARNEAHLQWAKFALEDYLEMHWVHLGWKTDFPLVCGHLSGHLSLSPPFEEPHYPWMLSTDRRSSCFTLCCNIPTSKMRGFNEEGIFSTQI